MAQMWHSHGIVPSMARKAATVEDVYQRNGSDSWYVRYRQQGVDVRKSFGRDKPAAIAYLEKARLLKAL